MRYELQPNSSLVYGVSNRKNALSKVETSIDKNNIYHSIERHELLRLTLSPQVTYQPDRSDGFSEKKAFTIAPKLICEKHKNSYFKDSCGYGLTFQALKLEERQSMMKLSYEDIGIRNGGSLFFEYRLAF